MTRHCIAVILLLAAATPSFSAMLLLIPMGQPAGQASTSLDKTAVRLVRTENGYEAILLFHEKRGILNLRITQKPEAGHALLPMAKRAELWKPLLEQVFQQYGRRKDYLLTVGVYPELGGRIAAAAACSGKWNPKTGRPNNGNAATALRDLLSDHSLYRELHTFFDAMGYQVSASSAEAVMLCRWKRVKPDTLDPACHPSMRPQSFVPCGASIVFRLDAKE